MNSRERVIAAIHHQQPDRVPFDLGATGQTGINASTLYRLRNDLGLPEKPIQIGEVCQMLGVVDEDLREALGVDVVGLNNPVNFYGVRDDGKYQSRKMFDGTPVQLGEKNALATSPSGEWLIYPQGDTSVPASGHMPVGGSFFDAIDRSDGFDEDELTPESDFAEAFGYLTEEDARYIEQESHKLYDQTSYAIVGNLGGGGLGDVAIIPGPHEKHPQGIRRMEDWIMAHLLYPEYIQSVFEMQTNHMLKNLEIYKQAVGDRIQIVWISGTDFGTQNCGFISLETFRTLYKPYYKRINDWVHQHTNWKTFYHSCGAISDFLDDFVDMGVDIINPVQLSAQGMNARDLKERYRDRLVFWGGGVDTQRTLPFGTPEEVKQQAIERLKILSDGGGYVFAAIHNVTAGVPAENLVAMIQAVREFK